VTGTGELTYWTIALSEGDVPMKGRLFSTLFVSLGLVCAAGVRPTVGACSAGGSATQTGLGGGDTNPHDFFNQCLARLSTSVTITISAVADLGCNSWDSTHDVGDCDTCSNIPCCDTDPTLKYLTGAIKGDAALFHRLLIVLNW